MGQYYTPILIDKDKKVKAFNSFSYDNGCKLMEHSYIGNNFVNVIMKELINNPHQVYWLGDYAEAGDFKPGTVALSQTEIDEYNSINAFTNPPPDNIWGFRNAYLINHDLCCYLRVPDKGDFVICPLPLLTAVGNGKGGGDYFGGNQSDIGTWAGHQIEVVFEKSKIPEGFTNVTFDYDFNEN